MASHDPRSSSTQSLVPDPAFGNAGRRTLLLIYIHGFMGNETSFQSFPAHVHNLVTITLADSHVVHTKIYPRYKSRNAIDFARDDFSNWLVPHESPSTDVVLLGHSMGGLLAADIALLFRHNVIGLVNFDVPFLGMHPGVVKAGLGSIFNPAPPPQHQSFESAEQNGGHRPSRMGTLFNPKPSDPNYNPSFYNDVHLPVRKGWENALHFMNKHSSGLMAAGKGLIKQHLEFGGAMADYPGLKARYARVRALEEDDEYRRSVANPGVARPPRIRFVNYYTASTGRPKKPKPPKSPSPTRSESRGVPLSTSTSAEPAADHGALTPPPSIGHSPRISIEEYREGELVSIDPAPLSHTSPVEEVSSPSATDGTNGAPVLPEIPPIPQEPPFVDLALYPDKAERRAAEKEHTKALKEYQKAVKTRNNVIKERTKLEDKHHKQQAKEAQKQAKADAEAREKSGAEQPVADDMDSNAIILADSHEQQVSADGTDLVGGNLQDLHLDNQEEASSQPRSGTTPYNSYAFSHSTILAQPSPDDRSSISESITPSTYTSSTTTLTPSNTNTTSPSPQPQSQKPVRYRKFCMLPPKDNMGNKDPCWVRVLMHGVDEVGAHCGLFFMGETYERLVGDVGGRLEEWVRETESMRVAREMSQEWA